MDERSLGHIVHFESNFDRWRPGLSSRGPGKRKPVRAASCSIWGRIWSTRRWCFSGSPLPLAPRCSGSGMAKARTMHSRFACIIFLVSPCTLGANCLSSLARPRFHLRGNKGNFWKRGLDPQEDALNNVAKITDTNWGEEPDDRWGTLCVDVDGSMVTRPVPSTAGDYRLFYAGVRDLLLGNASAPPVTPTEAWRVTRVLEWAKQSADLHRDVECDWSGEPA